MTPRGGDGGGGPPLDPTRPVRPGEELDLAVLEPWLRKAVPGLPAGPVVVEQFPAGHSNLTYLVRVGQRELVLRRPPFGSQVKSAHDMGRELRVLSKLAPVFPQAPRPVAMCDDPSVLGAPFYLMERIRGVVLRRKPPPGLALGPELLARLAEAFVDTLVALHAVDWRAAGLADLGKPEGYVERQVTGWTKRWRDAQTEAVDDMEAIARWLAERIPGESGACLIHNDFKYDNLVLDAAVPTRILGILDWEMATLGDPLMDLGTALAYWVEAGDPETLQAYVFGPTNQPGSPTRRWIADRYGEQSGRDTRDLSFYYCFALFKNAVVAQQIYKRYVQGLTKDDRFVAMGYAVRLLAQAAVEAARTGAL